MYIADLHIHSKYSRATSANCLPEYLDLWARKKGISLLGTGDFTHPAWRKELEDKLQKVDEGVYALKKEYRLDGGAAGEKEPRFVVSGEISSIYKKDGKTRKVHNVILLPGLEQAEELSHRLETIGNIHSDGRPILGLDSRDLLEITLETCGDAVFIPAHIWTPHFSMFGTFSGFRTVEECFGDLSGHIHALETGLSSDPAMNWRVSSLDGYTLVSNSDAHSPAKLGREANLIEGERNYPGLKQALEQGKSGGFRGTIEFFPEEGKYHLDGHRNCNLCLNPEQTRELGGRCPVCGRKITVGVLSRVEDLADRREGYIPEGAIPFESLMPLPEAIAASTGYAAAGTRTNAIYEELLRQLGDEFFILRQAALEDIERTAGICVAEGIRRLRAGKVSRQPGYDGQYGTIGLLSKDEIQQLQGQITFFPGWETAQPQKKKKSAATRKKESEEKQQQEQKLNPKQKQAVETEKTDVAVIAGPGSGKTKTLISRILSLLEERGVRPSEITAVTFTNKAAEEMRARLSVKLGAKAGKIHIGTFHSICLELLRRKGPVALLDGPQALEIAQQILTEAASKKKPRQFLQEISKQKNGLSPQTEDARAYQERLQEMEVMDFDDLLLNALKLSKAKTDWKRFRYLLVDEFQDINQIQYQLIHLWKSWGGNLFVIGDPDQSIYGFRGSEAQCFRKLKEDLPELEVIYLTENYRNSPQILQSALSVIAHNGGPARQLQAYQSAGEPVKMVSTDSELGQAIFVAKEINRLTGGMDMLDYDTGKSGKERSKTYSFSEIGVLFRTHRQAALLEKCLKQESIPYIVAGGESCLEDKMVRGVLGFLRYLIFEDPQGMRSCLRLLWNCPEDLACKAADRPQECREEAFVKPFLELAEQYGEKVKKEKPRKVFDQMRKQLPWLDTPAMEQLCRMAVFHGKMDEFLQAVVLGQEADLIYGNGEKYAAGAVTLMTLHAAKGLEFSAVFLCGVNEGCIPLTAQEKDVDLQEERRLFYVGMTRAKEELYLLHQQQPSPFLQEIPLNLLEQVHRKKRVSNAQQISMFDE